MHKVAGGAGYAFHGMFGLLPVNELLMMAFRKLIGIHMFGVATGKRGGLVESLKRLAGLVAYRPAGTLDLGGMPPVMTGAAIPPLALFRRSIPLSPWFAMEFCVIVL